MTDPTAYIRNERIGYFEDMLVASGWEPDAKGGWLAPVTAYIDGAGRNFREVVAVSYGRGHLSLPNAVKVQVEADLAYLAISKGGSHE